MMDHKIKSMNQEGIERRQFNYDKVIPERRLPVYRVKVIDENGESSESDFDNSTMANLVPDMKKFMDENDVEVIDILLRGGKGKVEIKRI